MEGLECFILLWPLTTDMDYNVSPSSSDDFPMVLLDFAFFITFYNRRFMGYSPISINANDCIINAVESSISKGLVMTFH